MRATCTTGPSASSFRNASDWRACALRSRAKSAMVPAAAAMTATMLPAAIKRLRGEVSGMGSLGSAAALGRELRVQLVRAGRRLAQERVHGRHHEQGDEGRSEEHTSELQSPY